jgi:FAD/FMN-containing dehydrogenase
VGALGVITDYTLQAVPAFRLHAIEKALPLDVVLERIDEFVDSNDHFEFFWLPHTPWALTKRNNRTEEPLQPLPKVRGWIEKTFMENVAFGALCHLGKLRPALIPRLATALPSSGKREYVNDSYKIFASPRIVRFYEMETAIPRAHLVPALKEIRAMIDARGYLLNFPVEVRFTAADDVPLSTAYERESAYIAVHVFKGMEYEPYFKDVEAILKNYGARPHWGKLHFQDSSDLARQYRRFEDFLGLRNRLDPQRVFANAYLTQVFGK